jgi:AAA+ superfamily predicted ATPase
VTEDPLAAVRARLRDSVPRAMPLDGSALAWLRERLALSATEEQVLWLLAAHELCPEARARVRDLATEQVADPTLDVVRRTVYGATELARAWHELGEHGRLRRLALIDRTDRDLDAPDHRQTLKASRRVLALVHGERAIDQDIAPLLGRDAAPPLAELEVDPATADRLAAAIASGERLVVLHGGAGTGRRSLCLAAARELGRELLVVDARRLAGERERAERQLRIVARECSLFERTPLVLHLDAVADRLDLVERELVGLALATSTTAIARSWQRPPIAIELPPLPGARRAALWARALPSLSADDADVVASVYPLAPALILAAGDMCRGRAVQPEDVAAAVHSIRDHRLAGLATRVATTQGWDDLVLPEDQMLATVELLARVRKRRRVHDDWGFAAKLGRGLGITALFSGAPGTGKTMCAGLIARELGTELYQVDLSRVVSKWIGETEQHLAALFDAAEASHAILLFDEADALFGKRTEIRSSTDRHANQQVDYLLQRIESFSGICILTSNHEAAIDEAFRRRLSIHVPFPLPDAHERARLWAALLPPGAPVERELGLGRLAEQFAMSGGYIRNAVVRAAFLAADEEVAISAAHLARAAQLEYEAMGKLVVG